MAVRGESRVTSIAPTMTGIHLRTDTSDTSGTALSDVLPGRPQPVEPTVTAPCSGIRRPLLATVIVLAGGQSCLLVRRFGLALQRLTDVRGLAAAEGLVQPAGVLQLRLDALTIQAVLHGTKLPAALAPGLGRAHRGDEQQGDDEAERRRRGQEPALGIADERSVEHRGLAGRGVLPHQITHQGTAEDCQKQEEHRHVAASGGRVTAGQWVLEVASPPAGAGTCRLWPAPAVGGGAAPASE